MTLVSSAHFARNECNRALDTWRAFFDASSFTEATHIATSNGWFPPLLGILVHTYFRGTLGYATDPLSMAHGYFFESWWLIYSLNLLSALLFVLFLWFLYFGILGSLSAILTRERGLNTDVFKIGGYLSIVFVPIFLVSIGIALTIPSPNASFAGLNGSDVSAVARQVQTYNVEIQRSRQIQAIRALRGVGWLLLGSYMVPAISQLYEIRKSHSVLIVAPVTVVFLLVPFLL